MSSDDEDFVFYGTPIEREEEITTCKKKAIAEASGHLRTALPPWKQEVRDEEGRRRFHGAFTGGFSAGFYNTVGSKEGWTPQSFTSSRKNRAEVKQQSIYNFLDEDEKSELEGHSLGTSMQFDTFGFTAVELARKQAEKEQQQRPSTIPGPVPDELVVPVTESIGVKLLSKMGWRRGRSIKDSSQNSLYDARREARKAFLAFSDNAGSQLSSSKLDEKDGGNDADCLADDNQFSRSMPEYLLNPKQDLYGLGYDPFKQAPEFREKKRLKMSTHMGMEKYRSLSIQGKVGPGFGIGALEELDVEDEDIYASGYEFQDNFVQEFEEPSRVNVDNLRILDKNREGVLPGFKAASTSDGTLQRFHPPAIPKDFVPLHKFTSPSPLGNDDQNAECPPSEVLPPEDSNLKVLIEGVATLVARCGKLFENLSREKNQSNPLFAFLNGGNGSDFYARKLWEERQKRGELPKLLNEKLPQKPEQLTAESRGKILGEKALGRSSRDSDSLAASAASVNIQFNLSDTFTKPASPPDSAKPFHDDPAKQKRFEQFLKEKYEGGLRTKDSGGASNMSESARARERLEFEAAAEAIQKGSSGKESRGTRQLLTDLSATAELQFTMAGSGLQKDEIQQDEESVTKAMYPKREEFQWRPAPILCKRFDLVDPYMGKPCPAPRSRSKIDSAMFLPDFIKTANAEGHTGREQDSSEVPQLHNGKQGRETTEKEVDNEVEVENVERPVDLYKAIFSDDSEDENHNAAVSNQVENTQKKVEAANTALNRLMAGDFLESLGKELGLAVPPEMPLAGTRVAENDTDSMDKGNVDSLPSGKKVSAAHIVVGGSTNGEKTTKNIPDNQQNTQEVRAETAVSIEGDKIADGGNENRNFKVPSEKNLNTQRSWKHSGSSGSSEDEWNRKRSRSHRHRSISSDSDTSGDSDDYRDRHRSRFRRKDKGTHREKSTRKRHSKRHHSKHGQKDSSPSRSHCSSEKRENRKSKKKKYEK